jgi:hypothetical protein
MTSIARQFLRPASKADSDVQNPQDSKPVAAALRSKMVGSKGTEGAEDVPYRALLTHWTCPRRRRAIAWALPARP